MLPEWLKPVKDVLIKEVVNLSLIQDLSLEHEIQAA